MHIKKTFNLFLIFSILITMIYVPFDVKASTPTMQDEFLGTKYAAVDAEDNLYAFISDNLDGKSDGSEGHLGSKIKKMDGNSGAITTVLEGIMGEATTFTVSPAGDIFISFYKRDFENGNTSEIRKYDLDNPENNTIKDLGHIQVSNLAVDEEENIYFTQLNDPWVKKISTDGTIRDLGSFDMIMPSYMPVYKLLNDVQGNIYIVTRLIYNNNTNNIYVAKIATNDEISSYTLPTSESTLNFGMTVDNDGNLYVPRTFSYLKINSSGIAVKSLDNTTMEFPSLSTLAIDTKNNLYIVDRIILDLPGAPYSTHTIKHVNVSAPANTNSPAVTPSATAEDSPTTNGLVITSNAADGSNVTHFKITDIIGGKLFKHNGTSEINNNDFISSVEGGDGLRFIPSPDANSQAGDTFSFHVQASLDENGTGLSSAVQAAITVSEVNDRPTAVNDVLSNIEENAGEVTIPISSLLGNDGPGPSNESGQSLTLTNVERIDGGDVRLEGSNVLFTPEPNYHGSASFRYTIVDDGKTAGEETPQSSQAVASFQIIGRADQPTVTHAETKEDTQTSSDLIITPTAAGGATTTHFKITGITGGILYKNDGTTPIADGSYITVDEGQAGLKFTPNDNDYGTTGFGFMIQAAPGTGNTLLSDAITASIIVKEVNDSPVAMDDTLTASYVNSIERLIDSSVLLGNDSPGPENENNQRLSIVSVEDAVGGTVRLDNGQVYFTPAQDFTGTASFRYTVEDNGTTEGNAEPMTGQASVSFPVISLPVMGGIVNILGDLKFGSMLTADIAGVTYTPNTTDDVPAYQWFRGETPILGANLSTYTLAELDIAEIIKVKVIADGIHAIGSVISNETAAVQKADSLLPAPPALDNKTTTSITLVPIPGQEFSIDDGVNWQDRPIFTGLTPNTEYPFISRIKATTTTKESVNSEVKQFMTDPLTYSVMYMGNHHTGGTVPADRHAYQQNENVSVLNNTGNLVRSGYTFTGWNTKADGSGTKYSPGSSFLMGSDSVTLYAVWEAIPANNDGGNPSNGGEESSNQGPTTEVITVPVETGTVGEGDTVARTPITRTTEANGKVKDDVILTPERAMDSIKKIVEAGQSTARIMIPDEKDKVSEVKVNIPAEAKKVVEDANINLEIHTENVRIAIPQESLKSFQDDLYFHLIPIKEEEQRNEVENRARVEQIVKDMAQDQSINVVARPMTIETNMQSRPVTLTLPLRDVQLPSSPSEREQFLKELVIFIKHSDGEKELVKAKVVDYKKDQLGLEFGVNKFSTFTILHMEGLDEDANEDKTHTPYIKGYGKEFRPNHSVTRGQMAAMLARNLAAAPSAKAYTDIPATHWAYKDVMEVKGAGIMTGRNATTFDSAGHVTRAQMAAIVYRWIKNQCQTDDKAAACAKLAANEKANYKDVSANHWASEAIDFMKDTDFMVGYEDHTFRPNEKLTRAQAVKVLNRLFNRGPLTGLKTATFPDDVPTTHWAFEEIEEAARNHFVIFDENKNEIIKE
ncbi:S-layer homology domain-containing protein [Cytobacillus massiliigabonensis]|uniref:S-layer homology domain-containing protein n=1 Tax=Cytobacillus massiliigabonensis TaxID=1871011 RepID=UPI0015E10715|nr:S-layer homology domain-containing protein [Cytobacillus massiliigabonensis]